MSNPIAIFIHTANVDGALQRLLQFASLLEKTHLLHIANKIFISYVGAETSVFHTIHPSFTIVHASRHLEAYELPTQNLIWNYAKDHSNSQILYLHTKGVGKEKNECIEDWINYMLYFCVERWEEATHMLKDHDTTGVDLLQEPTMHYSGNFWWAKASYIQSLPQPYEFANLEKYPNPLNSLRHNQEFWICYSKKAHACMWQSNINCYERHLHRYHRNLYDLKKDAIKEQMSKKVCIFFLTGDQRFEVFPVIIEQLSQIKNINNIQLLLLTNVNDSIDKYKNILDKTQISYGIESFSLDDNYMKKVNFALDYANRNNIPYLMKHDNDIICPTYLYDFLFDNTETLEDEKNLLLTPTLTSGIPTVEQFLYDFCSNEEQQEMHSLFLQYRFEQTWGVDYSHLNKHTINESAWKAHEFFQSVKQGPYFYKGVHPIRLYDKAIYRLNELVLKKKDNILKRGDASFVYDSVSPYFCNSIFLIKTDTYTTIVKSKHLYVDPYDEVPLNRYRDINQMNVVYTQNAAAIHIIYNSIPKHDLHEKEFMRKISATVDKELLFEDTLKKYEAVDTKKGTDKNTSHSYGSVYSGLFKDLKDKPLTLLEIGFDCGASLLAYADYFKHASIHGLDIEDHRLQEVKEHPRIRTHIGDALKDKNIFEKQYDLIIEDASHEVEHQIQHFFDFAPSVKPGGLYIIEDVNQVHFQKLVSSIENHAVSLGFSLDFKDLRSIKQRFDDILIVLKRVL
jgi:hypothetical protein